MKNNVRFFLKYSQFCILNSAFCIFLSAFLILNSAFSFGQEIEWQNTIGGNGYDYFDCIYPTSDGGYILAGNTNSNISGDKTENCIGNDDYWIVKITATGNIQWQNTIGGDSYDILTSIQQTTDGGYIMGGYSFSNMSGDKSENSMGSYDYWIVKTDSTGTVQWENTIGGTDADYLRDVIQTVDGGYLLGGESESNISGDKIENTNGGYDLWIVKIDTTGVIQWQNTIGGDQADYFTQMQLNTDGGYILGGSSWSDISGDKTENNVGNGADYWIIKTDATGNIQWQNSIGGFDWETLNALEPTTDGGYILGGYSQSNISGDKTENCLGNRDFWMVKTDSTGNVIWDNTIGGFDEDDLKAIEQTADGGYILGGVSYSTFSVDKSEQSFHNNADYWIVKTDSTGTIQWDNTIAGNSSDFFTDIMESADGGYILGGYSSSDIYGDKTENGMGGDYWIVKLYGHYNNITGTSFLDLNSNNIMDVGEPPIKNNKIQEQFTGRCTFTQQNGYYNLSVLDTGNFTVTPTSFSYYNATPLAHNATFIVTNQIDSLNNFVFHPTVVLNDLCITLTPTSAFRPGFNASYIINYENVGTTALNGIIKIYPDMVLSYVSSSQLPVSINTDSIEWNVGSLTPFQSGTIVVTFSISPLATIGSNCNTTVQIEPIAGDANPSCNNAVSTTTITGSYDPNDILVNEDTLFTTQLPSQSWLDYTIRFQNTGNDTAFTVNVLNPIDTTKLELSSIEFVNSSHPVNLNWIPWQRNMEFKFNNILLPDSNINEPLSHGFVHYRIKPKTTLLAGDSITNNAYIYFDFNAPVATNTAITRIVLPTGIAHHSWGEGLGVRCFPNPAKDEITVAGFALQNNQPAVLKIYDVMGKEVFSQSIVNRTSQIVNLKSFSNGVYFVQLQTGAKVSRVKFIKQ